MMILLDNQQMVRLCMQAYSLFQAINKLLALFVNREEIKLSSYFETLSTIAFQEISFGFLIYIYFFY